MKLSDKIKEVSGINEELIEKLLCFNLLGSYFNLMEEAIEELRDKELIRKFEEIQQLIENKRKKIMDTDLEEGK